MAFPARIVLLSAAIYLLAAACSRIGVPPGGRALPVTAVDPACQGLTNQVYQTRTAQVVAESNGQPIAFPFLVTFLEDGRVIWKYSLDAASGIFTCRQGVVEADFETGERRAFSGVFDAASGSIKIDGLTYFQVDDPE